MSILKSRWRGKIKEINLDYNTGKTVVKQWNLTFTFVKKVENYFVVKLGFQDEFNNYDDEYILFLVKDNKIKGTDTNGLYEGHFEDNKMYLEYRNTGHINNYDMRVIKGFNCTFNKLTGSHGCNCNH